MFNTGMNIPSLADIAAVTGNRNGNGWATAEAHGGSSSSSLHCGVALAAMATALAALAAGAMVPVLPARQMSSVGLTTRA